MRLIVKKIVLSAFSMLLVAGSMAQNLNSAYFLEGFAYRHELNPAYSGESYFSMPLLGNINVTMHGNVGLKNFLYPVNNPSSQYNLTTFLSPTIGRDEFLGDLTDNNKLMFDYKMNIFSVGFRGFGGFNTIGLNLRTNVGVNLPYGLFDFAKTGMQGNNTHYVIDDLSMRARGYAELALGHAHQINENLSIGAKLKFLVGGADVDATVERMNVQMSDTRWLVQARAEVNASLKGARFELDEDGLVDGLDVESPGVGGYGFGVDLGATYKFTEGALKGFTFSAALLDLGFINWSENIMAYNEGEEFRFDGFHNVVIENQPGQENELEDQLDRLQDDVEKLYNVRTDGKVGSRSTMLATTMNIGAEYALPAYDRLKFGLLSSTHFNGPFTWTEARVSANVNPTRWFGASVNYAYSTWGSSFGMMLNFHPKGFNFFIGTDHMLGEVNTQFIPMSSNVNVSMGINFILGKEKREK